jgi:hypothetical protein
MLQTGHTSDMNALEGIGMVFSATGAGLQGGYSPQLARAQHIAGTKKLFNACMQAYGYQLERKAE